jgi:hypothetical protein
MRDLMRTPALLLLVACGGGDAPRTSVDAAVDAVLSPRAQLIRLSLDLRGVRPTEAELTAVDADPAAYDGYVDAWLRDPRFGDQVEDLYNPVLRTRTANTYEDPAEAGIDAPSWEVAASVGSEPLKLIRHVVEQDRPFTEILTADYTLADPIVAAYWGLPHSGASAWERSSQAKCIRCGKKKYSSWMKMEMSSSFRKQSKFQVISTKKVRIHERLCFV